MSGLGHGDITALLLAIGVLLGSARLLGEIARRFKQPAVIGEILAGIILGPTILGRLAPGLSAALFPSEGPVAISLGALTITAITLFLLVAGLEVDLSTIYRRGRAALYIGVGGLVIPFAIGFAPALAMPAAFGAADPEGQRLVFALFLATAMAITALPVIAKILMDLQLFRTDLGMTIVAAAVFNDLVGWLIFAIVLAMIGQAGGGVPIGVTIGAMLAFTAFMLTVGRWLLNRSLPWIQAHTSWPGGVLGYAVTLALLAAAFTEWLGVHAIIGAFILGVALGDSAHLRERTRATIDQFVSFIFAPLFFAGIGLHVDFFASFDIVLVLVVLVIATVGKVFGCMLTARWSGFARKESWAIGFGMNARGAMEIILALLALEAGLIGDRLFVALVIMALVTSITSGTFMQMVLGRGRPTRFSEFAGSKTFLPGLVVRERREALQRLAELAAPAADQDVETVFDTVWDRERVLPTGIGRGVAVPHARVKGLTSPVVAIATCRAGVDFDAADGRPARIIILMLTPHEDPRVQLDILASVARTFVDETRVDRAVECSSWTEFLALLNAMED